MAGAWPRRGGDWGRIARDGNILGYVEADKPKAIEGAPPTEPIIADQ